MSLFLWSASNKNPDGPTAYTIIHHIDSCSFLSVIKDWNGLFIYTDWCFFLWVKKDWNGLVKIWRVTFKIEEQSSDWLNSHLLPVEMRSKKADLPFAKLGRLTCLVSCFSACKLCQTASQPIDIGTKLPPCKLQHQQNWQTANCHLTNQHRPKYPQLK